MKSNRALLVILFLTFGMLVTSIPKFVYAQTAENEIVENTLETVEKATTKGLSEITDSLSNASKSIAISTENAKESSNNNSSSQAFQQIENIATDMGNATESAIAGAREQIEESLSGAKSAVANATEGTQTAPTNATEGTQTAPTNATEDTQTAATNATEDTQTAATNATEDTQTAPTNATEGPIETGKNFVDQIWGKITNLFK